MSLILSVYFSHDRIYLAALDHTDKGLSLEYINSTEHSYDLENPGDPISALAARELEDITENLKGKFLGINITLPSDSVFVTQFPGNSKMKDDDIRRLINLEVRQAYPQYTHEKFSSDILPLTPGKRKTEMMMAVIKPNAMYKNAKKLLAGFKAPFNRVEISQFNAHTAFLYNYPERKDIPTAIIGLNGKFADVSIIEGEKIIYYNLINYSHGKGFGDLCIKEFKKIMDEYTDGIDEVYFFGTDLSREAFGTIDQCLGDMNIKAKKLNAFRLLTTSLGARERDYCKRTAHIHPPCIGAAIPPYHVRLKYA